MEFIVFLLLIIAFPNAAIILGVFYLCWLFNAKSAGKVSIKIIAGIIVAGLLYSLITRLSASSPAAAIVTVALLMVVAIILLISANDLKPQWRVNALWRTIKRRYSSRR